MTTPQKAKHLQKQTMSLSSRTELQMLLQTFTRNKAPLMLPESASRRSERKQRTSLCHRTVKNETISWQTPSAWRNWRIPWRRWRQGKPLDQMESQEKCIWQGLERGTSRKTTEDRCALQDVHVDPAHPICKDCPSKTWWLSQQKSLPL